MIFAPIQQYAAGATMGLEAIQAFHSRIPTLLHAHQLANDATVGCHLGVAAPGTPVPFNLFWHEFVPVAIPLAKACIVVTAM